MELSSSHFRFNPAFSCTWNQFVIYIYPKTSKTDLKIELPVITVKNRKSYHLDFDTYHYHCIHFGFINYYIALIVTLVAAFTLDRNLLFKIDYFLLITFVCFYFYRKHFPFRCAGDICSR